MIEELALGLYLSDFVTWVPNPCPTVVCVCVCVCVYVCMASVLASHFYSY